MAFVSKPRRPHQSARLQVERRQARAVLVRTRVDAQAIAVEQVRAFGRQVSEDHEQPISVQCHAAKRLRVSGVACAGVMPVGALAARKSPSLDAGRNVKRADRGAGFDGDAGAKHDMRVNHRIAPDQSVKSQIGARGFAKADACFQQICAGALLGS